MSVVQNTYLTKHAKWQNGQIATPQVCRVDTYEAELTSTDDNVPFGIVVQKGATAEAGKKGGTSTTGILGITVKDPTRGQQREQGDGYAKGSAMGVLSFGDIAVQVNGAVTAGDNVTFNSTSGELGTATASSTNILIKGAVWMDAAADNEIARVRIPPQFDLATSE